MASRFQYQARPEEAWQSRSEQKGSSFIGFLKDSVTAFAPQKAENWIRILPPSWQNPKHYGLDVWVHYGVGPQNATVLCSLKMDNVRCPICEAYTVADSAGREDAYDLKPTRRVLVWLINKKAEKQDTPEAWAMPWTLDRDISKLCRDRQTGELYQIDHPESGYDISFDREGEPPQVKYVGIQIARRPSPVEDKYLDYIVANPIPSTLIRRTYEEVLTLFEGQTAPVDTAPHPPQQQQQTAPPVANTREAVFGSAPVNGAPAPPVQQQQWAPPQQQPQQPPFEPNYCQVSVTFQGQVIACCYATGHQGDHLFERQLGKVENVQQAPQQPTVAPSPAPGSQPQQPQQQPQQPQSFPAQTQPAVAVSPRAASLRERFANAGAGKK